MDHLYHGYVSHNQRLFSHFFSMKMTFFTWTNYTNCIRAPLHLQPGGAMAMAVRTVVTDACGAVTRAQPGHAELSGHVGGTPEFWLEKEAK